MTSFMVNMEMTQYMEMQKTQKITLMETMLSTLVVVMIQFGAEEGMILSMDFMEMMF